MTAFIFLFLVLISSGGSVPAPSNTSSEVALDETEVGSDFSVPLVIEPMLVCGGGAPASGGPQLLTVAERRKQQKQLEKERRKEEKSENKR